MNSGTKSSRRPVVSAAACLLSWVAPAAVGAGAFAQTTSSQAAPLASTLTRNDASLTGAVAFHNNTTLGAEEFIAFNALNGWVCYGDGALLQDTYSAFTQRALCRDEAQQDQGRNWRMVLNPDYTTQLVERAVIDFTPTGASAADRSALRRRAERILLSLFMTNEGTAALQIQRGINSSQDSMLRDGALRDYAAVEVATEIASDARMLKQASNLVHEQGMPLNLVVRMLNYALPQGGQLLQIYETGRDEADYNPAARMDLAMQQLWNPSSNTQAISQRTRSYLSFAYPQGQPAVLAGAISTNAQTMIRRAAATSGIDGYDTYLTALATRVSQTPPVTLSRPANTVEQTNLRGLQQIP